MLQRLLDGGQHTFGLLRRPTATAAMRVLNARRRMIVLGLEQVLAPNTEVPQSGP
jgi:hypothetical protein